MPQRRVESSITIACIFKKEVPLNAAGVVPSHRSSGHGQGPSTVIVLSKHPLLDLEASIPASASTSSAVGPGCVKTPKRKTHLEFCFPCLRTRRSGYRRNSSRYLQCSPYTKCSGPCQLCYGRGSWVRRKMILPIFRQYTFSHSQGRKPPVRSSMASSRLGG